MCACLTSDLFRMTYLDTPWLWTLIWHLSALFSFCLVYVLRQYLTFCVLL